MSGLGCRVSDAPKSPVDQLRDYHGGNQDAVPRAWSAGSRWLIKLLRLNLLVSDEWVIKKHHERWRTGAMAGAVLGERITHRRVAPRGMMC